MAQKAELQVGFLSPSPLDAFPKIRKPEDVLRALALSEGGEGAMAKEGDRDLFMSSKVYCLLVSDKETNV